MVSLKLSRTGRKHLATYKLVAIDSRKKRGSTALEELGNYQPQSKKLEVKADRIKYWVSVGARPTDTVARLLVKDGVLPKTALPTQTFKHEAGQKSKDRAEAKQAKQNKPAEPKAEAAPEAAAEEVVVEETTETEAEAPAETADAETPAAE